MVVGVLFADTTAKLKIAVNIESDTIMLKGLFIFMNQKAFNTETLSTRRIHRELAVIAENLSVYAVLKHFNIEINQESQPPAPEAKICKKLRIMNRSECCN